MPDAMSALERDAAIDQYLEALPVSDRMRFAIGQALNAPDGHEFSVRLRGLEIDDAVKYDLAQLFQGYVPPGDRRSTPAVVGDELSENVLDRVTELPGAMMEYGEHLSRGEGLGGFGPINQFVRDVVGGTTSNAAEAMDSFRGGEYGEAALNVAGAVPVIGPLAEQTLRDLGGDDPGGAMQRLGTDVLMAGAATPAAKLGARGAGAVRRGATETMPRQLYSRVAHPTKAEKIRQARLGNDPRALLSDKLMRAGYAGDIDDMLAGLVRDGLKLEQQLGPRVQHQYIPFKSADLAEYLGSLDDIAKNFAKETRNPITSQAQRLATDIRAAQSGSIPMELGVRLKRFYDGLRSAGSFKDHATLGTRAHTLKTMADRMRRRVRAADPDVGLLLDEMSWRLDALPRIASRSAYLEGKPLFSFGDVIATSAGGVIGGPHLAGGAVAGLHAAQSPYITTKFAQGMYRLGHPRRPDFPDIRPRPPVTDPSRLLEPGAVRMGPGADPSFVRGQPVPPPGSQALTFGQRQLPAQTAIPLPGPSQPPTAGLIPAVSHQARSTRPRPAASTVSSQGQTSPASGTAFPSHATGSRVPEAAVEPLTVYGGAEGTVPLRPIRPVASHPRSRGSAPPTREQLAETLRRLLEMLQGE